MHHLSAILPDHSLVSSKLVLSAQSTTKDYIRAGGDFHKEIQNIVERTNKAEIRPEEKSEKAENGQENSWNEIQLKGQ